MFTLWTFVKSIFHYYTQFLLKITTLIGTLFIYLLGISLGHFFYKFSAPQNTSHWQKFPKPSPPEAMY